MINFIGMTLAVALGFILATIVMLTVTFNERFITWYTKYVLKQIEKVTEKLDEF